MRVVLFCALLSGICVARADVDDLASRLAKLTTENEAQGETIDKLLKNQDDLMSRLKSIEEHLLLAKKTPFQAAPTKVPESAESQEEAAHRELVGMGSDSTRISSRHVQTAMMNVTGDLHIGGTLYWHGIAWSPNEPSFAPTPVPTPEPTREPTLNPTLNNYGMQATRPGTSCADIQANNAKAVASGAGYFVDPLLTGTGFEVYCDMADGFTRIGVVTFRNTAYCAMSDSGAAQGGDPISATCCKLSDAVINALASGKVYYTKVPGYPSTYTKYSGTVTVGTRSPGTVTQGASYAAVKDAAPAYAISYGGWRFAHSNDW